MSGPYDLADIVKASMWRLIAELFEPDYPRMAWHSRHAIYTEEQIRAAIRRAL